jgi:prepilin-type N-terminal cleavage/methylation domain-containing protein/prepilin-type processing-associated H-X9-DG protein
VPHRRQDPAHPAAFTLVELLVVISIIAVLIGLLLPAVQTAREAARRSSCTNNLKQLGLGLQLHRDSLGYFPSGALAYRNDGTLVNPTAAEPSRTDVTGGWGWGTFILPFIEQASLYNLLAPNGPNFPASPTDATRTSIGTFLCPSESNNPVLHFALPMGGNGTSDGHARSSYSAVAGMTNPVEYRGETANNSDRRGMFAYNSRVEDRQVTDGLSKTMMLVERIWDGGTSELRRGGVWAGKPPGGANDAGNKYSTMIRVENSPSWVINGLNNNAAAGAHTSGRGTNSNGTIRGGLGVNVVMADGSVRMISENISGLAWQLLATRADNQPLPED